MKKILALVLALVLSLGLASVAFAAITPVAGGQLNSDEDNEFHKKPEDEETITYGTLITFWGCFDDPDWQVGNVPVTIVDKEDGTEISFPETVKWDYVITSGNQYVNKFEIVIGKDEAAQASAAETYTVSDITLKLMANDPVIAVNDVVKGYLYAYDAAAQDTEFIYACDFVIELRNHYIDVKLEGGAAKLTQADASGKEYTRNDLKNAIKTKEGVLYLEKHFYGDNSSDDPAYVITTAQFDTLDAFTAATVAYKDVVTVAFADAAIQDGINFKYAITKKAPTKADLYANPEALPTVKFAFLSAETVESETTVTFAKAFLADVKATIGTKDVYLYVGDTAVAVDLEKDVAVVVPAGAALGEYFFTAEAPVAEEGKDNVGTGASDMTSVCVALAVVSLVAAGAVCVKKVSK